MVYQYDILATPLEISDIMWVSWGKTAFIGQWTRNFRRHLEISHVALISLDKISDLYLYKYFKLTCILMILGSGCFVLAPPSMAMPKMGFVFLTVMCRFPWWSGMTLAGQGSGPPSGIRCMDWWRRSGPPGPPSPSRAPVSSFMSKLRDSLCANSCTRQF